MSLKEVIDNIFIKMNEIIIVTECDLQLKIFIILSKQFYYYNDTWVLETQMQMNSIKKKIHIVSSVSYTLYET